MGELVTCQACGSAWMGKDDEGDLHCSSCGRTFLQPKPPRQPAPAPLGRSGHPKLGADVPLRSMEVLATAIVKLLEDESGPLSWRQLFGRLQGRGGEERASFDRATERLVRQGKARWVDVDGSRKLEAVDRWAEEGPHDARRRRGAAVARPGGPDDRLGRRSGRGRR
jgi:hypothetical protein